MSLGRMFNVEEYDDDETIVENNKTSEVSEVFKTNDEIDDIFSGIDNISINTSEEETDYEETDVKNIVSNTVELDDDELEHLSNIITIKPKKEIVSEDKRLAIQPDNYELNNLNDASSSLNTSENEFIATIDELSTKLENMLLTNLEITQSIGKTIKDGNDYPQIVDGYTKMVTSTMKLADSIVGLKGKKKVSIKDKVDKISNSKYNTNESSQKQNLQQNNVYIFNANNIEDKMKEFLPSDMMQNSLNQIQNIESEVINEQ